MRCAEMAYASSVGNAHSSQTPTVKKWLKLSKMCVLAGAGYRASAALGRAAGESPRGPIPGQPPQKLPPNGCHPAIYLLWNVLPLWEMAIPFLSPVKKPGKNLRVVFRSNSPDEDSGHLLGTAVALPQAKRVKPDEAQAAKNDGEYIATKSDNLP